METHAARLGRCGGGALCRQVHESRALPAIVALRVSAWRRAPAVSGRSRFRAFVGTVAPSRKGAVVHRRETTRLPVTSPAETDLSVRSCAGSSGRRRARARRRRARSARGGEPAARRAASALGRRRRRRRVRGASSGRLDAGGAAIARAERRPRLRRARRPERGERGLDSISTRPRRALRYARRALAYAEKRFAVGPARRARLARAERRAGCRAALASAARRPGELPGVRAPAVAARRERRCRDRDRRRPPA